MEDNGRQIKVVSTEYNQLKCLNCCFPVRQHNVAAVLKEITPNLQCQGDALLLLQMQA